MNVYDSAHDLARAIKDSQEYKNYMTLKDEVSQIEGINEMLVDFQQKQFQIQAMQFSGQESNMDLMEQLQSLYQIIARDPKAMEYLQAEMIFSKLVADVYGILGEVVKFGA